MQVSGARGRRYRKNAGGWSRGAGVRTVMEPLYGEATRRRLKTIEARWLMRGGVGRQCVLFLGLLARASRGSVWGLLTPTRESNSTRAPVNTSPVLHPGSGLVVVWGGIGWEVCDCSAEGGTRLGCVRGTLGVTGHTFIRLVYKSLRLEPTTARTPSTAAPASAPSWHLDRAGRLPSPHGPAEARHQAACPPSGRQDSGSP